SSAGASPSAEAAGSGRGRKTRAAKPADPEVTDGATPDDGAAPKLAAADRRLAAATLLDVWASVGRDLAVAQAGGSRRLRELELVDEVQAIGPGLSSVSSRPSSRNSTQSRRSSTRTSIRSSPWTCWR
ncbi:MAG: hypothetical protein ACHQ01_10750, partial [Candidatus Limnocylindrales bacterium]